MALVSSVLRLAAVWLLLTGVSACTPPPDGAAPAAPVTAAGPATVADGSAPTLEELQSATYHGVGEAGGPFTLTGGRWEGKPVAPGAASVPSVAFLQDFRMAGDLDSDGRDEAVVLLAAGTGGTGEVSYLAVVGRSGGQVVNRATAAVGDRVQLRDARIEGRRIVLSVVQAGDQDPMCCPGDLVTRSWELDAGGLKEVASIVTGRLSLETLAGTEWVLRAWARDEPAPATPEVTLKLDGSNLAGSAGCNGYFAGVKAGPQPGDLQIGAVGTTRMMCPDPEMAVEVRFLRQLEGVKQMRFVAGQLGLAYTEKDGTSGTMLFGRRSSQ